jgi:hypothetical protein
MLCKISGFHGGDYEECRLLGCYDVWLRSMRLLLVTANVHSSPIRVTLMMEALSSSEISVLSRATLRNISEDGILHAPEHASMFSLQSCTANVAADTDIDS